jgi:hypothetical protein
MAGETTPVDPADLRIELEAATLRFLAERDVFERQARMATLRKQATFDLEVRNVLRLQLAGRKGW